jgi:hypothetical protein
MTPMEQVESLRAEVALLQETKRRAKAIADARAQARAHTEAPGAGVTVSGAIAQRLGR